MIDWKNLALEEGFRQGTMIVNKNGLVVLGRVESIAYDRGSGMATMNLGKVIESAEGKEKPDVIVMEKMTFMADESFPLQIENGAVKFVVFPFGNRGVLLPKGMLVVQSVLDAIGIGSLKVPYGAID